MAEYYPLLAKAVASLPSSTPETRRAIYERARQALLGQLRNLQPPVSEADIERESHALDAAVLRLETEFTATAEASASSLEATPPAPSDAPAPARPVREPLFPLRDKPAAERQKPFMPRPSAVTLASPPATAAPAAETPAPSQPAASTAPRIAEGGLAPDSPLAGVRMRPDAQRPYAQQQAEFRPQQGRRLWIVSAVVCFFVLAVAFAAWKLRDRPEDLARLRPPGTSQDTGGGKIAERIGGDQTAAAPQDTTQPPTPTQAPSDGPAISITPAKPAMQAEPPSVPVAHRAALLVEAPDEPSKVKTYIGTVVWHLDNVSQGPDQPLGTAVRADIDMPEDKLQATVIFQRNLDQTLPASHTIKILFKPQADSPTGTIKQISVLQMRREDAATGESLSGVPVPIMDNSFLIGLSRGTAEASNLDLIKTRDWFDIPMLLGNNKIAKLTFEKSNSGQRAIEDALASWQGQ